MVNTKKVEESDELEGSGVGNNSFLQKLKLFFKGLSWEDYVLIGCIIIILILQANLIGSFKQLPSPLYGGDYYHQMGGINHVKYGGDAFKSFSTNDPVPSYFPIYSLITGNIARFFNISAMQAMFAFSYVLTIIALLLAYWLGFLLFRNKSAALGATLLFFFFTRIPIIKYRQFTEVTFFLFFFVCLYYVLKTRDWKWALAAGLAFGIGSLSHGSMFLYLLLFMPVLLVYMLLGQYVNYDKRKFSFNKQEFKEQWKKNLVLFLIILVIGFALALVYWYLPLSYMASSDPALREIVDLRILQGRGDFYSNLMARAGWVFSAVWGSFIYQYSFVFVAFTILGILALFFVKKWSRTIKFILLITISTIFIFWHFLITQPLLGAQVPVQEMRTFILPLLMFMFSGLFLSIIRNTVKNKLLKLGISVFVIILVLLTNFFIYNTYIKEDRWIQVGQSGSLPGPLLGAADFIIQNTDVNDAILTNHELGFAINALTGRKIVSIPRGHLSPVTDSVQRDADLAVMLYGSNNEQREKLFKDYNVKYLFWDSYWLRGEFIFDQDAQVVGLFDPIEVLDKPDWREYLDASNVTYEPIHTELNPNKRGKANQFDVLVVMPRMNITHPWHPSLNKYLELKFQAPQNNPSIKVYKVNV
ncbi:hypothetical protein AYK26_02265 [Euryarchaeota archaeon SM23-78]|nr:MAG: hypothetical protein AYK26_02265 [Euryarchaeota archaeon SM23-78]MBW3001244.1 hypothetical protein [Candidatus Woesearchaeota archaeon]